MGKVLYSVMPVQYQKLGNPVTISDWHTRLQLPREYRVTHVKSCVNRGGYDVFLDHPDIPEKYTLSKVDLQYVDGKLVSSLVIGLDGTVLIELSHR